VKGARVEGNLGRPIAEVPEPPRAERASLIPTSGLARLGNRVSGTEYSFLERRRINRGRHVASSLHFLPDLVGQRRCGLGLNGGRHREAWLGFSRASRKEPRPPSGGSARRPNRPYSPTQRGWDFPIRRQSGRVKRGRELDGRGSGVSFRRPNPRNRFCGQRLRRLAKQPYETGSRRVCEPGPATQFPSLDRISPTA
jgi:hypothetical protein